MNKVDVYPKVSVVIPVYNGADFILDALDSVFLQDYSNVEVLVIDDCSTDATMNVLGKCKYPIQVLKNKINSGASHSRNKGIKNSTGKYIAFLDADDVWFKNKLCRQVTLMSKNSEAGLVYGASRLTNYSKKSNYQLTESLGDISFRKVSLNEVFVNPYFSTSTILIKRELCNQLGGFREDLDTAEDIDFVIKVALESTILAMNAPLSLTRRVENSLGSSISSYKDNLRVVDDFMNSHELFKNNNKLVKQVRQKIYNDWLEELVHKRNTSEAIKVGFSSMSKVPPKVRTLKLLAKSILLWPLYH